MKLVIRSFSLKPFKSNQIQNPRGLWGSLASQDVVALGHGADPPLLELMALTEHLNPGAVQLCALSLKVL